MARFEFRLKAVLALREAVRARCRIDLAGVLAERAEIERRLDAANRQLQAERHRCRASSGPVDVVARQAAHRFGSMLRWQMHELDVRRQAVTLEVERLNQLVVEADRDVRSLEKLHQRQLDQFRQSEARVEAKRLDEAARARESA